ncbi:MAG: thioredoxin [Candidatus Altimarinota bacterium]
MSVVVLNEENFTSEVSSGVVLVDFWAEWCGPCQMMLPILSDFANDIGDKVKVGKINVDENPSLAQQFRVMSIPTLIVLKDGKPVEMMVGVKQKEELNEIIGKHL